MTGYAAASGRREKAAVSVTVKSVNHRFLDLHLKMPAELEPLEPKVRRLVRERLTRGHLSLTIVLERDGAVDALVVRTLVTAYLQAYNNLRAEFGLSAEADLNAVLRVPGAVSYLPAIPAGAEAREMEALVLETLSDALAQLDAMRAEEGRAIQAELCGRLEAIGRAAAEIERLRAGAEQLYFERLRERLDALLGETLPAERLVQEAAVLVERSDVSEELVRLKSHAAQFQQLLAAPGDEDAGKRLDFLLQEMSRESNTILSKTSGLGEAGLMITRLGLDLKAEIEKLREQVQNLQ